NVSPFVMSILAWGFLFGGVLAQEDGTAKPTAPRVVDLQAVAYPRCVRIFDGGSVEGWEADPSTWSIVDGAMRGVGGNSRLAFTKADYGNFRLIFTARMKPA